MKIVILGGSGMLGSMVLKVLGREPGMQVVATFRGVDLVPVGVQPLLLDAETATVSEIEACLAGADWAVNCIGLIKSHIRDSSSEDVQRAIRINAVFPHLLAQAATRAGTKVLQIATDCVFSGAKGLYLENDVHDPLDIYGKTKSLGEVRQVPGFHNLRCSIIGPEEKGKTSLLEWLLGHPKGSVVTGYLNHFWNGVTTLQFARICRGILSGGVVVPDLTHVMPANILSKGALLQVCAEAFRRRDLYIDLRGVSESVDRTLSTADPALNLGLWRAAGYREPPTLSAMVQELAQFCMSDKGKK